MLLTFLICCWLFCFFFLFCNIFSSLILLLPFYQALGGVEINTCVYVSEVHPWNVNNNPAIRSHLEDSHAGAWGGIWMCLQFQFSSVAQSCPTICDPMNCSMAGYPSLLPRVCSNSCSLSQWCYLTISSSATHFSFCLQSFPASESFPLRRFFSSGGQSIGASAAVLPMNIQGWFPLGLIDLISLQSKGHSGVFSSTTIQKYQFFSIQPSLWSSSHIHTWLLEKP